MFDRILRKFDSPAFWIILAFLVWVFAFRGFLFSKLTLSDDALSYQEHTKFFIENISKGIFPLWDPFWFSGSSNDFFLRRIGALNPFYHMISLLESLGVSYNLAYLWFLAAYYWSGMIAFYLLSVRVFNDRLIAYGGYLILLFSALGTRLFDSYMMLVTVPVLWFFYFLIAFTQTGRKNFFLGLCLSFMILASTYIPFYFIFFMGIFLIVYSLFYFSYIPTIFSNYSQFFKANKILVIVAFAAVLFSFIPIIDFYHYSSKGDIVLTGRHGNSETKEILTVPLSTYNWGAAEDIYYSSFFTDLRAYKFAIIYIPFISCIILSLGLLCRVTRRGVFIFVCGLVLFCSILPHGLPFYPFLYKYIFFLKYFRNLHFFLWFILIPLYVFFVLENWQIFEKARENLKTRKIILSAYVAVIHLIALWFVWHMGNALISTYLMVFLSSIFWFVLVFINNIKEFWKFLLLTLIVIVQPVEVYSYLSMRTLPAPDQYRYAFSFQELNMKEPQPLLKEDVPSRKSPLYYANKNYNSFYENIDLYEIYKYLQYKFILVDHLVPIDPKRINFYVIEKQLSESNNLAFVFQDQHKGYKTISNDPAPDPQSTKVTDKTPGFKVLFFDANTVRISIEVPYERFLVYNDSFDSHWQAFVNNKPTHIFQTNIAFKGVWIPAGKSIVEFRYGYWWQYVINIFLMVCSMVLLLGAVWFSRDLLFLKEKN